MNQIRSELQALLVISANHVRKQGCPSVDPNYGCAYRAPGGLSCAAGPFIKHYRPDFERKNFQLLVEYCRQHRATSSLDPAAIASDFHVNFVAQVLQASHDHEASMGIGRTLHPEYLAEFRKSYERQLQANIANWNNAHPSLVVEYKPSYPNAE